ncbi:tripartite motif-containing protein 2-like [Dysidea avara]|uniref:tripartite motif-containing protein 2-like n=1 Tax=Dysidea avara TaxID=196820 RepID=UPI0033224D62
MAANQVTEKVPIYLSCPVCHELYKKPKYLPTCYHSYCEECLVTLQAGSDLICAVCKQTTQIPSDGVKQLPNHLFLTRLADEMTIKQKIERNEEILCTACIRKSPVTSFCSDCATLMCKECDESHKYSSDKQGHSVIQLDQIQSEKKDVQLQLKSTKKAQCQDHDMDLLFYCETCDQLVCHYCTTNDHAGHEHGSVRKMAKQHLDKMSEVIKPVDNMINKLTTSEKEISSTSEKIESQATKVEQEIDSYFDHLEQKLKQQREGLKRELHEVSTQKKKAILRQQQQLQHVRVQLEHVKQLSEAVKSESDHHEALYMKKQVSKDVKWLEDSYKTLETKPVEFANQKFSKGHRRSFPYFGYLSYGVNSSFNTAIAYIPAYGQVGKEMKFTITTKDPNHCPCQKGGSKITTQVKPRTGEVITAEVKDNQDGSYTASFTPTQIGELQVSVFSNGTKINKHPLSVQIHQHTTLDKPNKIVNDDGKIGEPWGIAFAKDGAWAITDDSNHCVCIFNSKDQLTRKLGSSGIGNGQFHNPRGLAFDANNHLYVVDGNNHRVQKFDINGSYLLQFGNKGSGDGQLNGPFGITVYSNRIFVAEYHNNRISVFCCDGRFSNAFGSSQLNKATDVAVTNNNQILVVEWGHHCISIFTLDGNYVNKISAHGSERGQLYYPYSVTTDLYDFIHVTEYSNNRISIFDKDGVFIHCFGSGGTITGQFSHPRGIAYNPNGSVYVCDQENKRIQIYSYC